MPQDVIAVNVRGQPSDTSHIQRAQVGRNFRQLIGIPRRVHDQRPALAIKQHRRTSHEPPRLSHIDARCDFDESREIDRDHGGQSLMHGHAQPGTMPAEGTLPLAQYCQSPHNRGTHSVQFRRMKHALVLAAIAAVLIVPSTANAGVGGELTDPDSGDGVGCVAGVDGDDVSLLCAADWRRSTIRAKFLDQSTGTWTYWGGWVDIPTAGQVIQHSLYGTQDTEWRVVVTVKDGVKANGRIDGRVVLPWSPLA